MTSLLAKPHWDIPSTWHGCLTSALQPIVDRGGHAVGQEALLRVEGPSGLVGPALLFALAEAQGWRAALDLEAARLAVIAARRWTDETTLLFVNAAASPRDELASWMAALTACAHDHGVNPHRLVVELNENQAGIGKPDFRVLVDCYRRQGIRFALDDVDGSARSLNEIAIVEPEFVKADGALIENLANPEGHDRLGLVLASARRVGAATIAEKVETRVQADVLDVMGVTYLQGWLTGRPAVSAPPIASAWRLVS